MNHTLSLLAFNKLNKLLLSKTKLPVFIWKAKKTLSSLRFLSINKIQVKFRNERLNNLKIRHLKNYYYSRAKIKVVGIGNAGNNVLLEFLEKKLIFNKNVDYLAINTNYEDLRQLSKYTKTLLLTNANQRLAGGLDRNVVKNLVYKYQDKIIQQLKGLDLLILVAGIGKGTGSGATPIIAKLAKDLNIPVISLVFYPHTQYVSQIKINEFDDALNQIKYYSSSFAVYNNNYFYQNDYTAEQSFRFANDSLIDGLESIINIAGHLYKNIDSNEFIRIINERKQFCFYSMDVNSTSIQTLKDKLNQALKIYQIEHRKINKYIISIDFGQIKATNKICEAIAKNLNRFLATENPKESDWIFGFYDNKISQKIRINVFMFEPKNQKLINEKVITKTNVHEWNQENVTNARKVESLDPNIVYKPVNKVDNKHHEINLKNHQHKDTDFIFESITKMFSQTKSMQNRDSKVKN